MKLKIILASFLYLLLSNLAFSGSLDPLDLLRGGVNKENNFDLYVLNNTGEMLSADYSLPPDGMLRGEAVSLEGIIINPGETKFIATAVNPRDAHRNTWINLKLLKGKDVVYSGIFVKKLPFSYTISYDAIPGAIWKTSRAVTLKTANLPRLPYSISAGDNIPGKLKSDSQDKYTLIINKQR